MNNQNRTGRNCLDEGNISYFKNNQEQQLNNIILKPCDKHDDKCITSSHFILPECDGCKYEIEDYVLGRINKSKEELLEKISLYFHRCWLLKKVPKLEELNKFLEKK